ncbi:MAG: histidine kinase [Okeania sp. SIO2C9]|uniref:ATP-binding protein n=1 Tax=Okeania sp. SIO2C9 TaxID=2607791 RepID=UPI0013C1FBA7|nr:ATP-binding protein [Okeania sp. SIO2C9]NEQ71980.1 histidine kinase [Okeania sp. SIO2C9]
MKNQTILNKKIQKVRRDYNSWVATETLEDYALRFAPKSFRKWSEFQVANTALGGTSFLALEAIGGSIAISYGFANSFWAILTVGIIIFLTSLPISYYASKYNIDMDLLTRGAGFGYIGSTITSLIYASFTFIFFALEAAIMAQALELYFHLPLYLGYLVCSIIIIPLVFFGVTVINQLQIWTQPIWLSLMISPYIFIIYKEPNALSNWFNFAGRTVNGAEFNPLLFGAAATVCFSLIPQIGEQVDYLRFLPDKQKNNQIKWWLAMILAGPGWIIIGVAKELGGAFLASIAVSHGVSFAKATQPIQMYLVGFTDIFDDQKIVLIIGTLFVIISQIKINVTNAYAGSLAWSNFFSRLTHNHPGRVVWLIFNVAIALVLMELNVFATLEAVLGLYSNVAIAWIGALVADLVINKSLGISPSYIEFKRAYLHNINPVGFGSMLIASAVSMTAFLGVFGSVAQAYCSFIALVLAFILAPIIAIITKGKYYIARENQYQKINLSDTLECCICNQKYEQEDMAYCPVYQGSICSLCCSLDSHCRDRCKETTTALTPITEKPLLTIARKIISSKFSPQLGLRVVKFLGIFLFISGLVGLIFGVVYYLDTSQYLGANSQSRLITLVKLYFPLLLLIGIGSWWLVLTEESRDLALEELHSQNLQLEQEIQQRQEVENSLRQSKTKSKEQTKQLQRTLEELKQKEAQLIQTEKMSSLGQLVGGVAHEINNPVSFIYGNLHFTSEYTQQLLTLVKLYQQHYPEPKAEIEEYIEDIDLEFLKEDLFKIISSMTVGATRIRQIVQSLRNFSHLDESELKTVDIHEGIDSTLLILNNRLRPQSNNSVIEVIKNYGQLPLINCYPGQLNQVLINLINNSIDSINEYNRKQIYLNIQDYSGIIQISTKVLEHNWVEISIADNGIGIQPEILNKLFDPFFTTKPIGKGTGLGLSVSYQIIVEKHQGKLFCISKPNNVVEFIIQIPVKQ